MIGSIKTTLRVLAAAAIITAVVAAPALAAVVRPADKLVERSVADNLVVAGDSYTVSTDVAGDLIAAGNTVTVTGKVAGSVIAAGGTVIIKGPVGGNIYAAGGTVRIESEKVGRDVFVGAGDVSLAREAAVAGSFYAGAGNLDFAGRAARELVAGAGDVAIEGNVGGRAKLSANKVSLAKGAVIGGDLDYSAARPAAMDPGAKVLGKTVFKKTEEPKKEQASGAGLGVFLTVFTWIGFFMKLATACLIIALFPALSERVAAKVAGKPGPALGIGFLFFIAGPPAIFLLMATIIGMPLAVGAIFAYSVACYIAAIFTALWIGERVLASLFKREDVNRYTSVTVGLLVIAVFSLIPFFGWLLRAVATLMGTGALLMELYRLYKGEDGVVAAEATAVPAGGPAA